jgi:hypothetical protein
MRRLLTFLGGLFLFFIVIFGATALWSNTYKPEATSYLDESLRSIAANWNQDELLKRAAPELLAGASAGQLTAMFSQLSPLGPLKSIETSTGGTGFGYKPEMGRYIYANYNTVAHFTNGDATIQSTLIHRDGKWKIAGFHVNPFIGMHPQKQTEEVSPRSGPRCVVV